MDRYQLMLKNLIDLGPCKKCEHFKMTYAGTTPTCDDIISVPGQYCHRKGRTFSQCFSIGKYVVCEARDCSGRMYILSLNMEREKNLKTVLYELLSKHCVLCGNFLVDSVQCSLDDKGKQEPNFDL